MRDDTLDPAIETELDALPGELRPRSGVVFYTGRAAFTRSSPLYLLGLNPGGDPVAQAEETVERSLGHFYAGPAAWSRYADDRWLGRAPGAAPMQRRVLHLLGALDLDPRAVPASNVVFVRSRSEAALEADKTLLLRRCWPVHRAVIDALDVRVVACFAGTAGRWVREALHAHDHIDAYREENARGWMSETYKATDGRQVVTLSHPGRADWSSPPADPTPLLRRALKR